MVEQLILSDCWSEYDHYKKQKAEEPMAFYPKDAFEINFLILKIRNHRPQFSEKAIVLSIDRAKRLIHKYCNRKVFVSLVMGNLSQFESFTVS